MTKPYCTVIIPTKNAMPGLRAVLEQVLDQQTPWPYDVIVVDSGSKDGTVSYLKEVDSVRLIEIPAASFGHGKTRNLAISQTDSKYVALLTHDAQPANKQWLKNLVSTAELDERIAGVFGRHIAYDHASPFTKRDLNAHFDQFLSVPRIVSRDTDLQRYESDVAWQRVLHFFSDNNALLRKAVWDKIPYPDVEFAEDQLWAKSIIEAGYSKAYANEAVVYHSHDYTPLEQLRRAFDESLNFRKYFGYQLAPGLLGTIGRMFRVSLGAFRDNLDTNLYGHVSVPHRFHRATLGVALAAGHFLGTNHHYLPAAVVRRISLDQALFRT